MTTMKRIYSIYTPLLLLLCVHPSCISTADVPTPPDNYHLAQHCCGEPNILERPCRTETLFNCSHGSYIVDPWQDANDKFTITVEGKLIMTIEALTYDHTGYCIARYEPQANESRYVARVCFTDAANVEYSQSMFTLKGTLAMVSVFFLGVTLYVYNMIVMRDTQDRVVRITIICLLFFFLSMGATQLFSDVLVISSMCTVMGEWVVNSKLYEIIKKILRQLSFSISRSSPTSRGSTWSWRMCGRVLWCRAGPLRSTAGTAGITSTPGPFPFAWS